MLNEHKSLNTEGSMPSSVATTSLPKTKKGLELMPVPD